MSAKQRQARRKLFIDLPSSTPRLMAAKVFSNRIFPPANLDIGVGRKCGRCEVSTNTERTTAPQTTDLNCRFCVKYADPDSEDNPPKKQAMHRDKIKAHNRKQQEIDFHHAIAKIEENTIGQMDHGKSKQKKAKKKKIKPPTARLELATFRSLHFVCKSLTR